VRGLTTATVYVGLLWLTGFLRSSERAFLAEVVGRLWRRNRPTHPA
jgi:hypothetical protein